jgi:DNA-directed RNA polymerase beta subunit
MPGLSVLGHQNHEGMATPGNVFYQRLRHMVSDKFQVRTQGPVNPLTRQPVKVRAVGAKGTG